MAHSDGLSSQLFEYRNGSNKYHLRFYLANEYERSECVVEASSGGGRVKIVFNCWLLASARLELVSW